MKKRDYYKNIWEEFRKEKNMVFISGPRQAGKTTFAEDIALNETASLYFNYDIPANKKTLLTNPAFFEEIDRDFNTIPLVILDEIHKYQDWKNYLKGIYDGYAKEFRFLVTGSGRLDLSRKKGDALAGRYLHYHLFPFTNGEIFSSGIGPENIGHLLDLPRQSNEAQEAWETIFNVSGFPEPFLNGAKQKYRRWKNAYHTRIIRDDIRDEFAVKQIDTMETLYSILPDFVGNPLSCSNQARTLKVTHKTIDSWITIFEKFMLLFIIRPYHKSISRSLTKSPKIYFFDPCLVRDESLRFENMAALELQRAVTMWTDYGSGDYKLWFLRNKDKEEVDFLITKDNEPLLMVEAKFSETSVSPHLFKFQNILNIPAVQLVHQKGVGRSVRNGKNTILIASAANWFCGLN
ncbi:MAG: ATP-binding protein [Desulfobacteraceae bacterium]|jgi:predicted AAA+ superfamily ATPase